MTQHVQGPARTGPLPIPDLPTSRRGTLCWKHSVDITYIYILDHQTETDEHFHHHTDVTDNVQWYDDVDKLR